MVTFDGVMGILMPIAVVLFFVFIIYGKLKEVIDPVLIGIRNMVSGWFASSKEKVEDTVYYGSEISYD